MALVVGFDLDMTLIDPRPGIVAILRALSRQTGVSLDAEYFAAHLGPPLPIGLRAAGAPEDRVEELADRYRELYPELVIPHSVALPGAVEALRAVHDLGGRTVVVTGKYAPNAALHVKQHGFDVDELYGGLWAEGKAASLVEQGAAAYVGDHESDVTGALAANAVPVGVTTGPCTRARLVDAGAAVVFDSLTDFPGWLRTWAG